MTYLSSLEPNPGPVVLDTSVLINIHKSTFGIDVLSHIPNKKYITSIVINEMIRSTHQKDGADKFIDSMISGGILDIAFLSEKEFEIYEQLTSGNPSLDDGEASTIAVSKHRNATPVIDEKKGRNRSIQLLPDNTPYWSLDLFCHSNVVNQLGQKKSSEAVYLALKEGRMRIHQDHCDSVVEIIGAKRAINCHSLPNYKSRRAEWSLKISD